MAKPKARLTIVGGPDKPGVAIKPRDPAQSEAFDKKETGEDMAQSVAADQLKSIIERVERLEEEKKAIGDDIKDVYAEAKANGFDTKVLRKIVSLRKQDRDQRMEEEAILELYKQALGMA